MHEASGLRVRRVRPHRSHGVLGRRAGQLPAGVAGRDNQIKMLEKAVQLDLNNQPLKRQLDQLKASK